MIRNFAKWVMVFVVVGVIGGQAEAVLNPFHAKEFPGSPTLHNHDECIGKLTKIGPAEVISSGRDHDVLPIYMNYLNELLKSGGVLEQLGLSIVPQVLMFAPGHLVSVLSALNMFPVGHWHDGAQIARAQQTSGGILELVYPGGAYRHSVYRDDINPMQNISIINHVIGHVIFGMHNKFLQTRTADAIKDSYYLYRMMERFYVEYGHDEVSEWYQFLLSLRMDQDMLVAINEPPESFLKRKGQLAIPRTRNLLQYMIATLPPDMPQWKKEMAKQFEKLNRYIPGAIKTKFMNEGLATLMMEVLPEHMPVNNDFAHHMENCCLLDGVATRRPGHIMNNLTNPYFMGWQGGMRLIRKRYHARAELAGKTLMEKDRAFFHWLTVDIIPNMEDSDFFPFAVDADWIAKENIYLDRPIQQHELNGRYPKGPPPPELGDNPGFREIVSRDPQKIIGKLVRMKEDSLLMMPTPATVPSFMPNSGVLELENRDGIGISQPLVSRSMVAKLWTMAQVRQGPVAIETTYITISKKQVEQDHGWWGRWFEDVDVYEPYRIRTEVSPDGRVQVSKVYRNGKTGPASVPDIDKLMIEPLPAREFKPWPEITDRFQKFLNEHMLDNYMHIPQEALKTVFPTLAAQTIQKGATSSVDLGPVIGGPSESFTSDVFDHIPTLPRSLVEYQKKVAERLSLVLQQAILGKARVFSSRSGMRVRALPVIPEFEYNTTFDGAERIESLAKSKMASPDLKKYVQANMQEEGEIGSGGGIVGDVDWGPGEGGGQGQGQGEQDGEPQPGEGDQPGGRERGDGGNDPSLVDIPLDVWGKMLGEEIELPNLRRLEGESDRMSRVIGRHKQRKTGIPRYDLIARQALKLGISDLVGEKNGNVEDVIEEMLRQPVDTFNRGLKRLRNQDWFVKGDRPRVDPDLNVAVYIQLDFSGSMHGWIPTVKKMSADLRALLMTKYKTVKIYFVPFDGKAVVVEELEDMLKMYLGGGTSYGEGFRTVKKHMDENHPYTNWDRIPLIFGDLMDYPQPEDTQAFEEMAERSQFVGVIHTGGWSSPYSEMFQARRQSDEFFGYEILEFPDQYAPVVFKALFRNPPK